jgi:lipopolysaccharide export system protein LptC
MGSQSASTVFPALALAFAAGCGKTADAPVSSLSTPVDAPDLSLASVAFARLSDGRVVARGNAERLDYRRTGGRLEAIDGAAALNPQPGSGLAEFGTVRFSAPHVDGEIPERRGNASGGVRVDTTRGDTARAERVGYDGDVLQTDVPVQARGPGYQVDGNGLFARTDGSEIRLTHGVRGRLQMEARR